MLSPRSTTRSTSPHGFSTRLRPSELAKILAHPETLVREEVPLNGDIRLVLYPMGMKPPLVFTRSTIR